jgi:hypothetical protein
MTVPLDLITQRNLILVKQIYQRAVIQSASHHSDVDRILSLISFDLANETLLKNAITAVDSKVKFKSDINELITTANTVFSNITPPIPPVPDAQKIRRVRNIRNGAMHEAKYPTASDISDCRTYTRDFLQQLVLNVWDKDFSSISMTELVKHPKVKAFLLEADKQFAAGKYWEAAVQAVAGFGLALGEVKSAIRGYRSIGNESNMFIPVPVNDIPILTVIGLEYPSYARYKRLTRDINVFILGDGSITCNKTGTDPTAEETAFIITYAVNSVIQIESIAGDLAKPFRDTP